MSSNAERRKVAIVVGFNESQVIGTTLSRCKEVFQNILYVDSSSTDGSAIIARDLGVHCHTVPKISAASARQAAVDLLQPHDDDILFFIDADVLITKEFVVEAVSKISCQGHQVLFGCKYDITFSGYPLKTKMRTIHNPSFLGGNFVTSAEIFNSGHKFLENVTVEEERFFLAGLYRDGIKVTQMDCFQGYHLNFKAGDPERARSRKTTLPFWKLYISTLVRPIVHARLFLTIDLMIIGFFGAIYSPLFLFLAAYSLTCFVRDHQLGILRNFDFRYLK